MRSRLLAAVLISTLAVAAPTTAHAIKDGGRDVRPGDWRSPAVAVFHGGHHPCSGVLLNSQWVLTARHCVEDESGSQPYPLLPASSVFIDQGLSPGLEPPPDAVPATQIIADLEVPWPDARTRYVDVALVRVGAPQAGPEIVEPVVPVEEVPTVPKPLREPLLDTTGRLATLWPLAEPPTVGTTLHCYGYGDSGAGYGTLRRALLTVSEVHRSAYGDQRYRLRTDGDGKLASGDSGGPCVWSGHNMAIDSPRWYLTGIHIGGPGEQSGPDYAGTDVAVNQRLVDWIGGRVHRTPPPPRTCGLLPSDHGLRRQDTLFSCNNRFMLQVRYNRGLVLLDRQANHKEVWSADIVGSGAYKAIMERDGNLVVYDAVGQPVWDTGTQGHPGAYGYLHDNGSLVIYEGRPDNNTDRWVNPWNPIWATGAIPPRQQNTWP